MLRVLRAAFLFAVVIATVFATSESASAQKWPPANAWERTETRTEFVGDVPFTVGSFSYWLRLYRADRVNYSESNYQDSIDWHRVLGPNTASSEKPPRDETRFFAPVPSSLAPLPALPPLNSSANSLGALAPIPNLPENAPALANLPSVAPLSPLQP